jgi:hypothetical protein
MKIIKATYGDVDCTDVMQKRMKNNILITHSNNNIIGDPSTGNVKYLNVEIEHDEKIHNLSIREGDLMFFHFLQKTSLEYFILTTTLLKYILQ